MFVPWPHQVRGVEETLAHIDAGRRRVVLQAPTGAGKTWMMADLVSRYVGSDLRAVLYTHRRLLVEQSSRVFDGFDLEHGIRAAGHMPERELLFQVASVHTEHARSYEGVRRRLVKKGIEEGESHAVATERSQAWGLHDADLVLVDEAHQQTGESSRRILDAHYQAGAAIVLVTATPVDMGGMADAIVCAGTASELRACGALVPCLHYGCDEPDLRHIGKVQVGHDLSENQNRKAIMVPGIYGRIFDNWNRLNPNGDPTIVFAPGVGESLGIAEHFFSQGVTAAHIDGGEVWINGETYRGRDARQQALSGSKDGSIKVLCNRFVLREGVDAPWLAHGVLATVFGSLASYLQAGGRLLRAHPGLKRVVLQDHGGNWWRHGSLNADRTWQLGDTCSSLTGVRFDQFRDPGSGVREPACCPRCNLILSGPRCPCGFVIDLKRKSRMVVQQDGALKAMVGDIFVPRRVCKRRDAEERWRKMYYRARNAGMTFAQAEANFARENNWGWPSRKFPLMPLTDIDFYRKVADVPKERLR